MSPDSAPARAASAILRTFACCTLGCLLSGVLHAQVPPGALTPGAVQDTIPPPKPPAPTPPAQLVFPVPPPPVEHDRNARRFTVSSFRFSGNTVYSESTLKRVVERY